MDQVIQHLLEVSLEQQAATQELARGICALTEDLFTSWQVASSPPRPSPKQMACHLLTKLTLVDDIDTSTHLRWWPYGKYGTESWLSPGATAANYHQWTYRPGQLPRQQMLPLLRTTRCWLRPEVWTPEEVVELVAMERFLWTLPLENTEGGGHAGDQEPAHHVRGHGGGRVHTGIDAGWTPGTLMDSGNTITLLRTAEFPWLQGLQQDTAHLLCAWGGMAFSNRPDMARRKWTPLAPHCGSHPRPPRAPASGAGLPRVQPGPPPGPGRQWHHGACPKTGSALLARPKEDSGENQGVTNPLYPLFQQIQAEGNFTREQREDDCLKQAWENVAVVDGVSHAPGPLWNPHFMVKNNLLYHVRLLPEGPQEALVLPRSRIDEVMHLAHHHPLGGHMARILPRFYWPAIHAEVKNYCCRCPRSQLTSLRKPPPAPLIPLPIIRVPFERIGMDIIGLLPKSGRGHEYILVMVDYATRYPEAVPLWKATSKAIAQELFLLCSHVGIPKDITNQGTPFVSWLVADL
ncbi:hypothetical protein SRHO_G00226440 [Serrasalmus rhombeus]